MKKNYYLLGLSLFLFSCQQQAEKNEEKEAISQYSIDQFYENISIGGGNFSPDETKLLVSSNETGIYNAFEIDIATGEKKQLTESTKQSIIPRVYFPNDSRFIYMFDDGGNENYKIAFMDSEGTSKEITPEDSVRNIFWGWSKDEQSMYLMSNKRDPKYMDIYKMAISEVETEKPLKEVIYQNSDGLNVAAISSDDRFFALTQTITNADGKMYLYDRELGEKIDISEHEGDALYSPQFFSNDNKKLFYSTDEGSDFVYLAARDLETGEVVKVFETNWDVSYANNSWNEKYRVIGINENAKTSVKIINQNTGKEVQLPEIEGGSITAVNISKSEKLARFSVSTSATPSNIYVYNFESGELKKLTSSLNPEIDASDLVEAQAISFKSFDGLEIPAIYYQPKQASVDNKVAALVWVHGGPGGQSRQNYSSQIQYLVNHGYAVLAVNNRGSSGYGKKFNHLDDKNHGDKDLKDCIAGKDFLINTGVVDTAKIGIIGGSYGGYMTMAALTYAPEEFKVGVNIFGVTNWLRTLKSIPPYWESQRKSLYDELGDPFSEDSVRLYEISPLFHTEHVTKPLMVLQGANDVRVLQAESDEIVAGVKANGVPVEYIIFDDEGHGFRKKENQIEGYGQVKNFLDKYLKGTAG